MGNRGKVGDGGEGGGVEQSGLHDKESPIFARCFCLVQICNQNRTETEAPNGPLLLQAQFKYHHVFTWEGNTIINMRTPFCLSEIMSLTHYFQVQ